MDLSYEDILNIDVWVHFAASKPRVGVIIAWVKSLTSWMSKVDW